MAKKIFTVLLIFVLTGFPVYAQNHSQVFTQIDVSLNAETKVEVKVDGLACPFCAYGLEKKLMKIDGIKDMKIDIKNGLVTFSLKEGKTVDEKTIKKIVKDAGFTAKEIKFSN